MIFTGKKRACTILAASIVAMSCWSSSTEAQIKLTPAQEQQVGQGQINNARIAYQASCPQLGMIQDTIIKWNRDRLASYRDDNHRGLRTPHMLVTNKSRVNAYSLPGGHIFVSDAMIAAFMSREFDPNTGISSGLQKESQFGNGFEIYGHSALAAAIAHEDSHWERNFLQQETDLITSHISSAQENSLKQKLQAQDGAGFNDQLDELGFSDKLFPSVKNFVYDEELKADRGAMEFLDNTDVYSPGSLMMVVSRMIDPKAGAAKKIVHPKASVRKQQVMEHINRLSNGRVQIDEAGRMKLDGKLFMGNGWLPARSDVTQYDRTTYVAGQLAKSIACNAKRISPLDDAHSISSSGNMIPLVAVNDTTKKRFVIDKFAISKQDALNIEAGKESGHSTENRAAKEIAKFLRS